MADGLTGSSAQVDRLAAKLGVLQHVGHSCDVPLGKIHDMDVIANRGSVGRGVVASPDTQEVTLTKGDLVQYRFQGDLIQHWRHAHLNRKGLGMQSYRIRKSPALMPTILLSSGPH